MAQVKVTLPPPTRAQEKMLARASRFNVVALGEQGGKTALGIEALLAGPKGALRGYPVAWFSATAADLINDKRRILRMIEPAIKRRVNAKRIELSAGGKIDFYSLEDTGEFFDQYATIVVDNAARVDRLMDRWEDHLQPSLKVYGGDAWFLSTPFGRRNGFHKLYMAGRSDPDWSVWQADSFSNPHIPADRAAELRALDPESDEYLQRVQAEFLENGVELSAGQAVIGDNESFLEWCLRLERDGLKVDEQPFTLSDRPAMEFIYNLIPTTRKQAYQRIVVMQKCAQVGFTVMEMLAGIYLALKFGPCKIGMYLPDMKLAGAKSTERFMPIVRTVPDAYNRMVSQDTSGKRGGEGNVLIRNMGNSRFYFLWTSGKAMTESFPMDVVSFDEVQEMSVADMEKTRERMSASKIRFTLMGSTANWPDEDINAWYKKGTQHQFHSHCPNCKESVVLDEYFPDCIGYDPEKPRKLVSATGEEYFVPGDYRYKCQHCSGWIDDPQVGEWLPRNPDSQIISAHFPQFLSPTISPREIIEAYNSAEDMKNFFNRKLGKPYTDPTQVPVNMEILKDCAALGVAAGLEWKTRARNTFMGIDQMGNFNVAIIKERMPDGRQAVVHIEYIYVKQTKENPNVSPFDRCDDLMEQYGVQCCVVETLPNYNDAKRFAQRHPGKVFLANYGKIEDEMMRWGDGPKLDVSDRRTAEDELDRYTVVLDQYKCMQVSMARFVRRICLFPDPQGLIQEVFEKGIGRTVAICQDLAFLHFTKTALVAEKDDEEKKYRRRVVKVGIDPHTSYANMLCDVAWARAHGTSMFVMPSDMDIDIRRQKIEAAMPGLPTQVLQMVEESAGDVCGRCNAFDEETRQCSERGFMVKPRDAACVMFIAVEN